MAFGSRALMSHEKNYHTMKLEFLSLKWVVTEHFKEYLPYQLFLVKTDNNPLTYIMTTPNLDATGHQWVEALARLNFQLEYQKGCDNTVADVLSQDYYPPQPRHGENDPQWSNPGSCISGAKVHDPTIIKGNHGLEQEVCVATGHMYQYKCTLLIGPKPKGKIQCWLSAVLDWLEIQKKMDLKTLSAEHASSEEG